MSEIRWTDKVYLDNQGNIRDFNGNEIVEKPKLTDEQIKNLEEDGRFEDIELEKYRLAMEVYYND